MDISLSPDQVKTAAKGLAVAGVATATWYAMPAIRRGIFTRMLKHQGWLLDPDAKSSRIFLAIAAFVSPGPWPIQEAEDLLPHLPVPPLEKTLQRYLRSVQPLLTEAEFNQTTAVVNDFAKSEIGAKAQGVLMERYATKDNWLSEWWLNYVYLSFRDSIALTFNWYGVDRPGVLPATQCERAAKLIRAIMRFKATFDSKSLETVCVGPVPLSMGDQYRYLWNSSRRPGEHMDELVAAPSDSPRNYVIILRKHQFYVLPLVNASGEVLSGAEIENQLEYIVKDADALSDADKSIPVGVLTADNRTRWYHTRNALESLSPANKRSLALIENAMFAVSLDDDPTPETTAEIARAIWHGDGKSRWFDKSFNLVITQNSHAGVSAEHSFADAPIVASVLDYSFALEPTEELDHSVARAMLNPPERLKFTSNDEIDAAIGAATQVVQGYIQAVDLAAVHFQQYGKGIIKEARMSPDGFVQAALQYAYYKVTNKFTLTYESSMTRLFKAGRTETVRSCTNEMKAFVEAMASTRATRAEKLELLRKATANHVQLYREAMVGQGVDRHFFGLRVASSALTGGDPANMPSMFKDKSAQFGFKLSTSQTPARNTMGGGFAPTDEDGFGCSYVVHENELLFHVTSYRTKNEAQTFANAIQEALNEMHKVVFNPAGLQRKMSQTNIPTRAQ